MYGANQQSCAPNGATPAGQVSTGVSVGGDSDAFLAAIRTHESAGSYTARSSVSDASGAYQFLFSTWRSEATAAGETQWANTPAYLAPPAVQDAVAAFMAEAAYNGPAQHQWLLVADVWFIGHVATPAELDRTVAGNGDLTPRKYRDQIAALMAAQGGASQQIDVSAPPAATPSLCAASPDGAGVVALAQQWLGTPYLWGGGHGGHVPVGTPVDCSGLVDQVFNITGTTYTQIALGTAVGSLDQAQPGDLVFFGPLAVAEPFHVGIYVGNGKMIDAPHTGSVVRYDDVAGFGQVDGIRRIAPPPGLTGGIQATTAACTATPPATVQVPAGGDVAAAVNTSPAGAVIALAAGTYRVAGIVPKSGQTIVGAGPNATIIAGSGAPVAFSGPASRVTLASLEVTGFAPGRLHAAIDASRGTSWTICNVHATANTEECIAVGPGALVDHVVADFCGNVGIGTGTANNDPHGQPFPNLGFTVQNSELAYNGAQDPADAAGAKVLFTTGAVFINNSVHNNYGFGLWTDAYNRGTVYKDNRVTDNQYGGIFHELSYQATITGNTVTGNAVGFCPGNGWFCGAAGVAISESSDVTVTGNTLTGNPLGIVGYNGHGLKGWLRNLHVQGNTLTDTGASGIQTIPFDPGAASSSQLQV